METNCSFQGCERLRLARGLCHGHYEQRRLGKTLTPLRVKPKRSRPVLDRILERLDVGDCWIWTGGHNGHGYGRIFINNRSNATHRKLWELLVGPIPDGMTLDHLCRVKRCCNPDHLEVVTNRENGLRGYSVPAMNARKTRCKRGHPYDKANTRHRRDGYRVCRACEKTWGQVAS